MLRDRLYATIDYIYSRSAFESGNGFTNAQSFLNVIETMLNIEYLYLAHSASTKQVPGREARGHATAPLIGFAAAIMTLSKTLLYHLQGEQWQAQRKDQAADLQTARILLRRLHGRSQ